MNETWKGYLRDDGRKGIRNLILVVYTVECASHVAHKIAEGEEDVQVIGFSGCYGNDYASRLLESLAHHPNVGAVLSVGLGCEYTQPKSITESVRNSGRPSEWFFIQESGGTIRSIDNGKNRLKQLREIMVKTSRPCEMDLSDLVIGSECGGSDATSGLVGNPVVGRLFDYVVDRGGTAIFEEIVELIGLRDILVKRSANAVASQQLLESYNKAEKYCHDVRQFSISPGNFTGGLTTIEEKSLGAYAKSGNRPIQGVIRVSECPPHHGLWLLDSVPDDHFMQFGYTNPNDTEGIMDLISAGSHIVLFITGRGSVIGSPIAPLIKVTGNSETYQKLEDDMDFNAGRILDGETSLDESARELLDLVIQTAGGKPTKPEQLGHAEYFIPYKHQQTPDLQSGCRV